MLFSISVLALFGYAVLAAPDSPYGGWQSPRAGVVKGTYFLEGGVLLPPASSNGDIQLRPYGTFFELPFCRSFDISTDSFNTILESLNETLDGDAVTKVDGYLFADNDEFYTYGGMAYPTSQNDGSDIFHAGLNQPNPDASLWVPSLDTHFPLEGVTNYITNGAGVSVSSESLGFYFSGLRSASGGNISFLAGDVDKADTLSESFISVDMSVYEQPKWTSLEWPSNIQARAEAGMAWVPVSKQGLLIVIGGLIQPSDMFAYSLNSSQMDNSTSVSPGFMTQLPVYDIASQTWFLQNTSGTPPDQLGQFCTVVTSAQHDSSFQIYLYGGYNGLSGGQQHASDEVWVLSVPSFKWIKVSEGDQSHRRRSHVCTSPAPNQMITVGGTDEIGSQLPGSLIDVFDLNTLSWTGKYDPNAWEEYKVPSQIQSVIRNSDGSNIVAAGMDSKLAAIFNAPYSKQIVPAYPYQACGQNQTQSPNQNGGHNSTPTWEKAVIGAVVGIAVVIAGVIVWFCCRKQRNKYSNNVTVSEASYSRRGFVSRWVQGTQQHQDQYPKTYFSETTTEVGEPLSPPLAHEVEGYFKPRAELPVTHAGPQGLADGIASNGFRSPRTPQSGSAEVENNSRHELASDYGLNSIRNHPMYPQNFARDTLSSIDGTVSSPSEQHLSSPSSTQSPKAAPVSPYELPQNRSDEAIRPAPDSTFKLDTHGIDTPLSATEPTHMVSPLQRCVSDPSHPSNETSPDLSPESRPIHRRNTSSMSSGMVQLPSPSSQEDARRSQYISSLPSNPNSPDTSRRHKVHDSLDEHLEEGQHVDVIDPEERRARQEWSNF